MEARRRVVEVPSIVLLALFQSLGTVIVVAVVLVQATTFGGPTTSVCSIVPWEGAPAVTVRRYRAAARAVVVLFRKTAAASDPGNAVEANRPAPV